MRNVHSVVIERNTEVVSALTTEPHEVGWATEAIFFVDPLEPTRGRWTARLEISPDGRKWVRHGEETELDLDGEVAALPTTHFGNWLRLVLTPSADSDAYLRCVITVVLK